MACKRWQPAALHEVVDAVASTGVCADMRKELLVARTLSVMGLVRYAPMTVNGHLQRGTRWGTVRRRIQQLILR